MNFKFYELLIKTENAARKYVLGFCFKNQQRFCLYCGSRKFWKLTDGRRRCQRCKMTYHDLTDRWWNKVNLPMDDWLRIVKLFELELSTRIIASQLELPYKTVWKAVMVIRHAIFCHVADANKILMSGEIELDESYFGGCRKGNRGRGAAGKVPVFGILTREGKVHIDGLEGFLSWTKKQLFKHHGISPKHFPLYLKELEFRYNHRFKLIFEQLVAFMSDFVPELPGKDNPPLSSTS